MDLLKVMNSPWAIVPAKLAEIEEIYVRHVRGDSLTTEQITAKVGKVPAPQAKDDTHYLEVLDNGVAVLTLDGVVAKKMNLFSRISGGTSTEIFGQEFQQAVEDPAIKAIVLRIDSPGGTVDGTQELAQRIYGARGQKPIVGFTDGVMASAAYWIGAAADRLVMSGDTVEVGSIGVVATHVDISKMQEKAGVKTTEIVAGKYKRIASNYAPLSDIGRATIQDMLDQMYSAFVEDVAQFRGVSTEKVLDDMADGRIFIGKQALRKGLIDERATFDETIASLARGERKGVRAMGKHVLEDPVTIETLREKFPATVTAIEDTAKKGGFEDGHKAGFSEGKTSSLAEGKKAGAEAERARIKAVQDQLIPGHEALIETLKWDGVTSGPEAAVKIVNAEKGLKAATLANLHAEAPKPLPPSAEPPIEPKDVEGKRTKLIKDIQERDECSYQEAAMKAAKEQPALFRNR